VCAIEDVSTVTNFLHSSGTIVYYANDESLANLVILDPQWLTKVLNISQYSYYF
jgi:hypothetical protein